MEQRIEYNQVLKSQGARITETGRLAITLEQYESLNKSGDVDISETEWLKYPSAQLFEGQTAYSDSMKVKVANALEREGLCTTRDILAAGKGYIIDIGNLGDRAISLISGSLLNAFNRPWYVRPSVSEISQMYDSAEDVPLVAITKANIRLFYYDPASDTPYMKYFTTKDVLGIYQGDTGSIPEEVLKSSQYKTVYANIVFHERTVREFIKEFEAGKENEQNSTDDLFLEVD